VSTTGAARALVQPSTNDISAVYLDEIRQCIDRAREHLKERRLSRAVGLVREGERCHRNAYAILVADSQRTERQALDLIHIELRLLHQRIREVMGL
jgi:hypothetical protein